MGFFTTTPTTIGQNAALGDLYAAELNIEQVKTEFSRQHLFAASGATDGRHSGVSYFQSRGELGLGSFSWEKVFSCADNRLFSGAIWRAVAVASFKTPIPGSPNTYLNDVFLQAFFASPFSGFGYVGASLLAASSHTTYGMSYNGVIALATPNVNQPLEIGIVSGPELVVLVLRDESISTVPVKWTVSLNRVT